MDKKAVKEAWGESFRMIASAAIAIAFGVALVQLMRNSAVGGVMGMMDAMAKVLSEVFSSAYIVIAPFIGVLGAFISGSNTVSNIMFTNLQYQTALDAGLKTVMIVGLQVAGGAIGNITCINNVVAACATVGTVGSEGKIIKTNVIPMLLYAVVGLLTVLIANNIFGIVASW